jgi:SAM-dependent methyltransferase
MRKDLIDKLRCPVTGEKLTLHVMEETEQEVTDGILSSSTRKYEIINGVAEILPPLDAKSQLERTSREEYHYDWNAERQRPYLNDHPDPAKWPGRAANVEQGLAQVALADQFVLDLGAGTGWSTRMICERGAQAVALDLSTSALRDAAAQFATGVYFDRIAATMTDLPFQDKRFDVVFSSASVHHADSLDVAFQEISRVLKPGGHAILSSEPVNGLLKRSEDFGQAAMAAGMNEHIYRLNDYLRAAHAANLKAWVLFPADLERQLNGTIPAPTPLIGSLRGLWRWIPTPLRSLSLKPGMWLVGMSLLMVAEKR